MISKNSTDKLVVGDKVRWFTQSPYYENKWLDGVIISFNFKTDMTNKKYPLAHIKANCEYGNKLLYNNTILVCELTKIN